MSKKQIALLAAIGANFIWGLSGFTIKIATEELSPNAYIIARFLPVTLLLLPWAIRYFPKKMSLKKWGLLLLAGIVAGPINYLLVVNGLAMTNLSSASFILFAEPVLVFLLASWLLRERLKLHMKAGLCIAFVGACLIAFGSAGLDIAGVSLLGNVLILGVIIFSALDLIISKQIMKDVSAKFLLWFMAMMTTLASFIFISPSDVVTEVSVLSGIGIASVLWGVLANTIVAYYCYFFAIKTLTAGEVGIFRYLDPVVGVVVGFTLLAEAFSPIYVVGGVIVVLGIIVVEKSTWKIPWHKRKHKTLRHHHRIYHHPFHRG